MTIAINSCNPFRILSRHKM